MKAGRLLAALAAGCLLLSCRSAETAGPALMPAEAPAGGVGQREGAGDLLDLTLLSPTMLYAEVGHINVAPEEYKGRVIRMTGTFAAHRARDGMQFVCNASDAAGCCLEPLEFVLKDERVWPDEYPAEGAVITVEGTLETYSFNEYMTYCRLVDAVLADGE